MKKLFVSIMALCLLGMFPSIAQTVSSTAQTVKKVKDTVSVVYGPDGQEYYYVPLTMELIKKMGSDSKTQSSELSKFQFYPSADFEIQRSTEKVNYASANSGVAQKQKSDFVILFSKDTPGVMKTCSFAGQGHTFISVYFDNGDNDFLTFSMSEYSGKFKLETKLHANRDNTVQYRGDTWSVNSESDICLMVRFTKDFYRKYYEKAKGRTLK